MSCGRIEFWKTESIRIASQNASSGGARAKQCENKKVVVVYLATPIIIIGLSVH